MSEETNNLGEDAKEFAGNAKEKASELAGDAKEAASEFADDAKEVASDFKEGAKDAFDDFSNIGGENKKMLAGILGILLGGFGAHKFILGYTKEGIIQLVVTFITCGFGSLIGLVEGIIYLTKSDEEFYETYQKNKKSWF